MKILTLFRSLCCLIGLAATCAAAPVVQPLQFGSVVLGSPITLQASVTDPGGSLISATFYVSGPAVRDSANLGAISWPTAQLVGAVTLSGTSGSPQIAWTPPQSGSYTVTVYVADQTATVSQTGAFECVADRLTVAPVTVASGANTMYTDAGEIVTTENDATSNVVAQGASSLIFWSGGRVDLKPGFHASNGSFFWAAVDHNQNGYSDVEEATCTSGDGIPDAWKVDHGLSIGTNYSSQPQYLAAYLGGYNPANTKATSPLPTNPACQLVLPTPSSGYYGVNTSTWTINGL